MNLPVSTASWHPPPKWQPIRYDLDPAVIQTVDAGNVQVCHARVGGHPGTRFAANPSCCSLQWPPPDCVGGRIAHRPSDGRPKALVSPLTREARPRRRNGQYAGAALQDARHNKERIYPELVASGRCRLVVLALEIGGCWSQEMCTFLRLLASHRERQAPQIIQQAVSTALLHRWAGLPC